MATWISIGKVAKLFGVSTQSIRNWTRQGKLQASKTVGKHRRYSLEVIQKMQNEGMEDSLLTAIARENSAQDEQSAVSKSKSKSQGEKSKATKQKIKKLQKKVAKSKQAKAKKIQPAKKQSGKAKVKHSVQSKKGKTTKRKK